MGIPPPGPVNDRGIVLFSRHRNRFITNEDALVKALSAQFKRNVTVLSMEEYTIEQQVWVME